MCQPESEAMDIDQDGTLYWLTNTPTIADLRELNKWSLMTFPLPMLSALLDAGVDLEKESTAVIRRYINETPEVVECRWAVRLEGKLIAILGETVDGFRALTRRKEKK